jgi:hypothetical protein
MPLEEAVRIFEWSKARVMITHESHLSKEKPDWVEIEKEVKEGSWAKARREAREKMEAKKAARVTPQESVYNVGPTAMVLSVFGVLLFIAGGLMVADGFMAAAAESNMQEPSAIRGIENVAEYGLGFIVFALGLLLCGISALLRKKT